MKNIFPEILILKKGEKIIESLLQYAKAHQLKSAVLSGLGAFAEPKLGFYNLATKQYQYKIFNGCYEVVSLNGNITQRDGEYVAHVHVALSDANYEIIGGHLVEAVVGVTAEIAIFSLDKVYSRKVDAEFGLALIE